MRAEALAEGPVQNGAHAAGFVYFAPLHKGESKLVVEIELVDTTSNKPFGHLTIPLTVNG
jgi:hypothetical protein